MKYILTLFFLFSILLESSVTTIPLVFLVLLSFFVLQRKEWVFALAFLAGIFLDVLSFRIVGTTSIFFLVFLFLVFLYERKFETATSYFIFATSLAGSILFLSLFSYNGVIIVEGLVSSLIGVLIFMVFSKFNNPVRKEIIGSRV